MQRLAGFQRKTWSWNLARLCFSRARSSDSTLEALGACRYESESWQCGTAIRSKPAPAALSTHPELKPPAFAAARINVKRRGISGARAFYRKSKIAEQLVDTTRQ